MTLMVMIKGSMKDCVEVKSVIRQDWILNNFHPSSEWGKLLAG